MMKAQDSFPLMLIGWFTVVIAVISMFATPALSQENSHLSGVVPAFVSCLQADGDQCRLIAPTVGIVIGVADGDALISYLVPSAQGLSVDHVESVGRDVDAQVVNGTLSVDDAAYIFAELLSSHDLRYKLPENPDVLKNAVGFGPSALLSPQDQVDILASHVQINLGVSAITADYLVTKLGLQILEPEDTPHP